MLFKTCCVNAATCISLHDTILKSLYLHFSDIFEDKLNTTMERKKELEAAIYTVLMVLTFIRPNLILNTTCTTVTTFLWN